MARKKVVNNAEMLSWAIVEGMKEKKAIDIVVLDLRKTKHAVADFFVLCSGNSSRQLDAIADSIDQLVFKKVKENPWHTEGKHNKEWLLLDYVTVVAHIFQQEKRKFYALEKLWGDAVITEIE